MQRVRFPLAVLGTSLALVLALVLTGGFVASRALASGIQSAAMHNMSDSNWPGSGSLPPEITSLAQVPQAERFSHFLGVQVSLKDANGNPLQVTVTPGTITTASATSLTLAANDGSSRTVALTDATIERGQPFAKGQQPLATPSLAPGEQVVVVTLNNSSTATAVFVPNGSWSH